MPTLAIIGDVYDPITREPYSRDPRFIAHRAEAYLKQTGIGDTIYFGPEPEFFIFSDVRYGGGTNEGYYHIDSREGWWNSGKDLRPNFGGQIQPKRGYFPLPPTDTLQDVRSRIVMAIESAGVPVEIHHHEVATAGQAEIDMRFDTLTRMADNVMIYKYMVEERGAAERPHRHLHAQAALRRQRQRHALPSEHLEGRQERLLRRRRLRPAFGHGQVLHRRPAEARAGAAGAGCARRPTRIAAWCPASRRRSTWPIRSATARPSAASRSAPSSPKSKRVEFRAPDPSCNPYLCFAALLMAGLDGVQNRIDPGEPMDKDLYGLPPEEAKLIKQVPGSLDAVLHALEADHEFLLKGDVFTTDLLETYIAYKRETEVDPMRMRPHPYEFTLYYDA